MSAVDFAAGSDQTLPVADARAASAAFALSFARRLHLTYPLLHDRDGATARRFGVTGYPETVVLDRRGRIAAVKRGPVDDAFMRDRVRPLLREPAT